jgi:hypothetical protein
MVLIQEEIEKLDKEINEMNLPFDKALLILQEKLWKIADNHGTSGSEIFMLYMNWKSSQNKKQ